MHYANLGGPPSPTSLCALVSCHAVLLPQCHYAPSVRRPPLLCRLLSFPLHVVPTSMAVRSFALNGQTFADAAAPCPGGRMGMPERYSVPTMQLQYFLLLFANSTRLRMRRKGCATRSPGLVPSFSGVAFSPVLQLPCWYIRDVPSSTSLPAVLGAPENWDIMRYEKLSTWRHIRSDYFCQHLYSCRALALGRAGDGGCRWRRRWRRRMARAVMADTRRMGINSAEEWRDADFRGGRFDAAAYGWTSSAPVAIWRTLRGGTVRRAASAPPIFRHRCLPHRGGRPQGSVRRHQRSSLGKAAGVGKEKKEEDNVAA